MVSETRVLANFCAELCYEDLPHEVVKMTQLCLIDWLGSAIGGSTYPPTKIVVNLIEEQGGAPEATIINSTVKSNCANVALTNGVMSHILELDDVHRASILHPAAAVIPAALSLAEKSGADGKRLITAIVSGYEADIRIGEAVGPSHYNYWHNTGTCGAFGAAAASGNVLGLDLDQMANAFGSAGTQTSGLWQFMAEKAMSKHLHPGRAASTGVISALLAKRGFTGSTTILEGDRGFFKATSSDSDPSKITEGLGEKYKILETSFKPHASCRHTHSPVDAALIIRERDKVKSGDIKSVRIGTYPDALKIAGIEDPLKPYEAKFSSKYCVSTALLRGTLGLEEFNESMLQEPKIRGLMKKCKINISPVLSRMYPAKWPAEVEVITKTGKRYRANVDYPLGDPENPVSREKLEDKFRSLARGVFSMEKVERIIEIVFSLDEVSNIRQLAQIISSKI